MALLVGRLGTPNEWGTQPVVVSVIKVSHLVCKDELLLRLHRFVYLGKAPAFRVLGSAFRVQGVGCTLLVSNAGPLLPTRGTLTKAVAVQLYRELSFLVNAPVSCVHPSGQNRETCIDFNTAVTHLPLRG